jgi:hypothetical protein
MSDYDIDLSDFPPLLRRVVVSWYRWQNVRYKTRPPTMTSHNELCFADEGEISYYLTIQDGGYYIDDKERGSRRT